MIFNTPENLIQEFFTIRSAGTFRSLGSGFLEALFNAVYYRITIFPLKYLHRPIAKVLEASVGIFGIQGVTIGTSF